MSRSKLNGFTKYEKIKSPFVKNESFKNTKKILKKIPDVSYNVTEKIDGTNIRIVLTHKKGNHKREILVGSRNQFLNKKDKNSKTYYDCLKNINLNKIKEYFNDIKSTVVIYGEGYGAGIQKGAAYSQEKDFRVFDVRIGGHWASRHDVHSLCVDCQLKEVPLIEEDFKLTYTNVIELLKKHRDSLVGTAKSEGVMIRSNPELFDKRGNRVIYKIKFKDFENLR